jgi:hypothetical protein
MPLLEIPPERISEPNRLDLGYLEALMLYPDEPETRQQAAEFCIAESIVEGLRAASNDPGLGDQHVPADVTTFAREAPRLADFAVERRRIEGTFAGMVLRDIVARYEAGIAGGGVIATIKLFTERMNLHASEKSAQRWWQKFRSVSPLWAAREELCERIASEGKSDPPFPCQLNQLVEFLGYSEFYRRWAETIQVPHSPGPILRPGEAYALLPGAPVPQFELAFSATEQGFRQS